jgi:acetyl esterase/lipase
MNRPSSLLFRAVLLPGLFLPFAALACGPAPADEPGTARPDLPGIGDGVIVYDDVPYDSGDSDAWTLDLALPTAGGDALRPAIVLVHGGGWRAGWKQDRVFRSLLLDYANQGYVTLSVEYRLHDEAPFPASVADVKCSVRWLRAHADELGVDPARIGAYGHSAGAHLALMLAVAPDSAGLDGEECDWMDHSSEIASVAAGATPTEAGERLQDQWGRADWWPIGYISGDVPPILLLQGIDDPIVRVELVDAYVEKMEAAGADIAYVRVPGGHGVAYEDALDVTKPAMDEFFARTLGGEGGEADAGQ